MNDEILTVQEVAELLKVDPNTIYLWAKDEKIPHSRIGKATLRFIRSEILQWMQNKNSM